MKYKICVVTGTRAEYGLLKRTIKKLDCHRDIELILIITGSHLCESFGNTQTEIYDDGFTNCIKVPIPINEDSKYGMAYATGVALTEFSSVFEKVKPDIVLVLGDRYEIFAVVSAAFLLGIPIAHIAGGDVTEGAVDDAIRHCITKMASIHFPGCDLARKRIIQMGEQPQNVFNVGEPGVENCLKTELLSREELYKQLNFDIVNHDYCIVTFHPVTMENDTAASQVMELIAAMDEMDDMFYIITMANADAGGRAINDIWMLEGRKRNNWLVVSSLGVLRYLSAIKYSRMVIGNSSSGLIEAPALNVPTINIGDRQKGRMIAQSVLCCLPQKDDIYEKMTKAQDEKFLKIVQKVKCPFGDGSTSDQIVFRLLQYLNDIDKTNQKHFYDIDF